MKSKSTQIIAIFNILMSRATKPTFKHIFWFDFNSLWAFVDFMTDYFACSTDYYL